MACRHLFVSLHPSGDVAYAFFRHHSENMLSRYLVEHPAGKVSVTGGQKLASHGYRHSVTPEGFLLLEWDPIREDETRLGRGINYVKHGRMERIQGDPPLWRFTEQFKIKWVAPGDTFELRLHHPNDRISAVKALSRAEFVMNSHGRVATHGYRKVRWHKGYPGFAMAMTPAQLSGAVFHCSGTLQVDWVLELTQGQEQSITCPDLTRFAHDDRSPV